MLSDGTQAIAQGTVFIVKLHLFVELESADCSSGISGFTGVNQCPMRLWEKKHFQFGLKCTSCHCILAAVWNKHTTLSPNACCHVYLGYWILTAWKALSICLVPGHKAHWKRCNTRTTVSRDPNVRMCRLWSLGRTKRNPVPRVHTVVGLGRETKMPDVIRW